MYFNFFHFFKVLQLLVTHIGVLIGTWFASLTRNYLNVLATTEVELYS